MEPISASEGVLYHTLVLSSKDLEDVTLILGYVAKGVKLSDLTRTDMSSEDPASSSPSIPIPGMPIQIVASSPPSDLRSTVLILQTLLHVTYENAARYLSDPNILMQSWW